MDPARSYYRLGGLLIVRCEEPMLELTTVIPEPLDLEEWAPGSSTFLAQELALTGMSGRTAWPAPCEDPFCGTELQEIRRSHGPVLVPDGLVMRCRAMILEPARPKRGWR